MKQGTKAPRIVRPDRSNQGTGFAMVFDFLRDQLLDGAIRNGDRLLPERELALQLGVSRPIVREALRAAVCESHRPERTCCSCVCKRHWS